jgi:hypothetical protein
MKGLRMEGKEEKEIILDLSGRIQFSDTIYITLGTFLLSVLVMVIQLLICLSVNDWQFTTTSLTVLLDFVLALRSEEKQKTEPMVE